MRVLRISSDSHKCCLRAHSVFKQNESKANMAKKPTGEMTGKAAASAAARVLADPASSRSEKKAAASALTQAHSAEATGTKAASAASKVLRNPKSSKDAKTAAASALTQKAKAKKKK